MLLLPLLQSWVAGMPLPWLWCYAKAVGAMLLLLELCGVVCFQTYNPINLCCCCLCCYAELLVWFCYGSGTMMMLLTLFCCYWCCAELLFCKPTILQTYAAAAASAATLSCWYDFATALVICWCCWRYSVATGAVLSCRFANLQSYKPVLLLCCCCLCCYNGNNWHVPLLCVQVCPRRKIAAGTTIKGSGTQSRKKDQRVQEGN